jgi:hypothetical protein
MNCKHCGEEMIEYELIDLGYGQRLTEYECPNYCDFLKYCNENGINVEVHTK